MPGVVGEFPMRSWGGGAGRAAKSGQGLERPRQESGPSPVGSEGPTLGLSHFTGDHLGRDSRLGITNSTPGCEHCHGFWEMP